MKKLYKKYMNDKSMVLEGNKGTISISFTCLNKLISEMSQEEIDFIIMKYKNKYFDKFNLKEREFIEETSKRKELKKDIIKFCIERDIEKNRSFLKKAKIKIKNIF